MDATEPGRTQITRMDSQAETLTENAADAVGIAERRGEGELERFTDFVEARGEETGAWRGEI